MENHPDTRIPTTANLLILKKGAPLTYGDAPFFLPDQTDPGF